MIPSRHAGLMLIAMLSTVACNDQTTEPLPADLVIVQAPSTVGAPGWELIDTLIVRAVDPSGAPRAGVEVTWVVRQGGGSIAPTTDETDADGLAKAVWTLGSTSGVNRVRAGTLEGAQANFESTGEAFRVDRLSAEDGFACGLRAGALWCWGAPFWGNSSPVSVAPNAGANFTPGLVDDTHHFVDLAVAGPSVCGLDGVGMVWCATAQSPTPTQISDLPAIRQIAGALLGFTYLRSPQYCGSAAADSTAWCWTLASPPSQVIASPALRAIWLSRGNAFGAAVVPYGDYRACGLQADSVAVCWGVGPAGDGPVGSGMDSAVVVSGGHRFVELVVGDRFSCGRTTGEEA